MTDRAESDELYNSPHLSDESRPFISRELLVAAATALVRADEKILAVQEMKLLAERFEVIPDDYIAAADDPIVTSLALARRAIGEALKALRTKADHQIPYLRDVDVAIASYTASLTSDDDE